MMRLIVFVCALEAALTTAAFSKTIQTKTTVAQDTRHVKSPAATANTAGPLRQDLFDRLNPRNLRSDWPAPPAQPGQF
ncbi:hypothetical protein FXV83_01735 [Bradyrhizobium hipponense]|uniref:Uncharacterized protein n=1 Tax=Bradyrhizobium hipponense TaxID=2605638 RepID=A0A5S4YVQ9_9BRAD|nr:hypothetical protein [Bradyrhizobium hipponense]TYO68258.1 hypothetical protein FXV83_01735 [Bradyrhizobium hipponense]